MDQASPERTARSRQRNEKGSEGDAGLISRPGQHGRLFYLMGPSGAGKDSLILACREALNRSHRCLVAHRHITRPPEARGENHLALSKEEFLQRQESGYFAMHWQAHGCYYGISREINLWLDDGFHVLVNGSRGYLENAVTQYPERLVPVYVRVDSKVLRQRLLRRGRESVAEIERRIARAEEFSGSIGSSDVVIDNNGELSGAVDQLMRLIRPATV